MISSLEKKVTFRFLKTKKNEGFVNIITIFSFIGITLGVAILIIVMSVMNGFRSELINKIVGFNAHVIVKPYEKNFDKSNVKNLLLIDNFDYSVASNTSEGVIINKNYTKGISVRGYKRKSFQKLDLVNNGNFEGNKNLNSKHISIGKELSFTLDVGIGDKIILMSPFGVETIVGALPKQESYIIDSIFDSGLFEFDQNVVFMTKWRLTKSVFQVTITQDQS